MRLFVSITGLLCLLASQSMAQEVVAEFKTWSVYGKDGLCYAGTPATTRKGNAEAREPSYLMVTHRKSGVDEISIASGENYAGNSEAIVLIGNKSFKLFTQDATAWAYSEKADRAMVEAMKKGATFKVKARTSSGKIEDSYALAGFGDALKKLQASCK